MGSAESFSKWILQSFRHWIAGKQTDPIAIVVVARRLLSLSLSFSLCV
jgi:hypothetical protein